MLISQNPEPAASDHEWDLDTESIGGAFEVEVEDVHVESVPDLSIPAQDRLDIVNTA